MGPAHPSQEHGAWLVSIYLSHRFPGDATQGSLQSSSKDKVLCQGDKQSVELLVVYMLELEVAFSGELWMVPLKKAIIAG